MSIATALYEEKVMDPTTGRMLNAGMDFYRLAGIGDVGELVVHMMTGKGYDERGPIGLGEPPTVGPMAAIANAVTNAIGVRVPFLPHHAGPGCWRALNQSRSRRRLMRAFSYASPTKKEDVAGLLGKSWGEVEILAGGTDLLALMKDDITTPHRLVNIKGIQDFHGVTPGKDVVRIGALTTLAEIAADAGITEISSCPCHGGRRSRQPADPQHGHHRRQSLPASALLVLPQRLWIAGPERRQVAGDRR